MPLDIGRVQAILFDVDGTLADTDDEFIRRAGQRMRRLHFLFPQRDLTNFLRWSLMISETPLNLLAGVPDWLGVDDELARFFDWLSDRRTPKPKSAPAAPSDVDAPAQSTPVGLPLSEGAVIATTAGHFVLMAGVEVMLARLAQRYPLGIVTARGERAARGFVEQFRLEPHIRVIVSAQTAPHTKPYPDPILWAAGELKVPVEACLMVGDTTVDILAGKRAGAETVGVLCGFGQRDELERTGASLILEHTAELAGALEPTS